MQSVCQGHFRKNFCVKMGKDRPATAKRSLPLYPYRGVGKSPAALNLAHNASNGIAPDQGMVYS